MNKDQLIQLCEKFSSAYNNDKMSDIAGKLEETDLDFDQQMDIIHKVIGNTPIKRDYTQQQLETIEKIFNDHGVTL